MTLFDGPFDEGIIGAEIKDVVFVDPWGDDEEGAFMDGLRGWFVLDELHEVIAVDDGAFGGGDIFAECEGSLVSCTNGAAPEIFDEVFEAA